MSLEERIKEIIVDQGLDYNERPRTLYTTCPSCGRSDKCSIIKENGATICYHGGCEFGRAWFQDWLSLTAGISIKEARKQIYDNGFDFKETLSLNLGLDKKENVVELDPTKWPVGGFLELNSPEAADGVAYLKGRGVSIELAKYYDIRYSPWFRRVVLPIKMNGEVYGWQARAIDKVDDIDRMRNNTGFRKDQLLMFQDGLKNHNSALLFEGPFDALKFHGFGGILCSMGKNISDTQIKLINDSDVDFVYLGLDPDASEELRQLTRKIEKKIKVLVIPISCEERCEKQNKKADFGECTNEEIKEAFENAKDFSDGHVFIHLKKFF